MKPWVISNDYRLSPGELDAHVQDPISKLTKDDFPGRLYAGDGALWQLEGSAAGRLGWLRVGERAEQELAKLEQLAEQLRNEGFDRVVLIGMGGSSLFPWVLTRIPRTPDSGLPLEVLDSVLPEAVAPVLDRMREGRTLVVAASKSGTTLETLTLAALAEQTNATLVAITDPGSALERRAKERGYRAVVAGHPDVGGRYSALTPFGLLPALLAGWEVGALLEGAASMLTRCGPGVPVQENPGAVLGASLAGLGAAGRDVVSVCLPGPLGPFTAWTDQLLAESLGKQGQGLWPVPWRPGGSAGLPERVLAGSVTPHQNTQERASLSWEVGEASTLGAEVVRWQVATAAAAAVMHVNPFDEPDVGAAKHATKMALTGLKDGGSLAWGGSAPLQAPSVTLHGAEPGVTTIEEGISRLLAQVQEQHRILSILAYVPVTEAHEVALETMAVALEDRLQRPLMIGFGPRYLHATGQLHKGGSDRACHLLLTTDPGPHISLPDDPQLALGDLALAQALADAQVLRDRRRHVLHLHVDQPAAPALAVLRALLL